MPGQVEHAQRRRIRSRKAAWNGQVEYGKHLKGRRSIVDEGDFLNAPERFDAARRGDPRSLNARPPGATWWKDARGPVVPGIDDLAAARTLAKHALDYPIATIRELLRATQLPVDAVAALAMIQPLPWYQAAVAEGLGLPRSF